VAVTGAVVGAEETGTVEDEGYTAGLKAGNEEGFADGTTLGSTLGL